MRIVAAALVFAGAATTAGLVVAQTTAPVATPACAAPAALPADMASFARPMEVALGGPVLIGKAATLGLGPAAGMVFPITPAKVPVVGSFGGNLTLDVTHAGTYRVALGGPVWIDVVRDGKAIASSAHEHGPACSAIRKIVDFALMPGHYTLQLSGARMPRATVLVVEAR